MTSTEPSEDSEDFIELQYRQHAQSVFGICLRFGGNIQWAEDVTHDVFIRLMENREKLDLQRNIPGWLHRVAYRCCLDRLRRERSIWNRVKQTVIHDRGNDGTASPEVVTIARQELQDIMESLQRLPARQQVVFTMRHLDHFTQKDIADTLGISEGSVSKLLKRATRSLHAQVLEREDA